MKAVEWWYVAGLGIGCRLAGDLGVGREDDVEGTLWGMWDSGAGV